MASTSPAGIEPASASLAAELVPREEGRAKRTLRRIATVVGGLFLESPELGSSDLELVVSHRGTGEVVLRVSAGRPLEASYLIDRVKADLDTKTVAEFLSEWR